MRNVGYRHFFCPRIGCRNHRYAAAAQRGWYEKAGFYSTRAFGSVQRYRCRTCGKYFSDQTFKLTYYLKKDTDFRAFARALNSRSSDLFCARHFHYSSSSMQTRVERLARNGLFLHSQILSRVRLDEHLVADGLESYTRSKYFPTNITILIGADSQFVYDFNLCHFRRKGRMSDLQRMRAPRIYDSAVFLPNDMKNRFSLLLCRTADLIERRHPLRDEIVLSTDENPAYAHALADTPIPGLVHRRISSTAPRTRANPLYSANYFDRQIRKDLVNHRRKTVCQAKNDRNMMCRFSWYVTSHNYLKPYRISSRAAQTEARHFDRVRGAADQLRRWRPMLFTNRFVLSMSRVDGYLREIWMKSIHSPQAPPARREYIPQFALG